MKPHLALVVLLATTWPALALPVCTSPTGPAADNLRMINYDILLKLIEANGKLLIPDGQECRAIFWYQKGNRSPYAYLGDDGNVYRLPPEFGIIYDLN